MTPFRIKSIIAPAPLPPCFASIFSGRRRPRSLLNGSFRSGDTSRTSPLPAIAIGFYRWIRKPTF
jgi:hypothetical protein